MPAAIRKRVVFPHPEGPSKQTVSAGSISRLTPRSASLPSKDRAKFSKVNRAAMVAAADPRRPQPGDAKLKNKSSLKSRGKEANSKPKIS